MSPQTTVNTPVLSSWVASGQELAGRPDVHVAVSVGGGDLLAVGTERHAPNLLGARVGEGASERVGGDIPQVDVVVLGGGKQRPVGAERHRVHPVSARPGLYSRPGEGGDESVGGDVP